MSTEAVNRMRDAFIEAAENDARTNTPAATLNDLLGALADAQAFYIAALPTEHLRATVMASADMTLRRSVAQYVKAGFGPHIAAVPMPSGKAN